MKKYRKSRLAPGIETASLPDIIFMLLFFFMVVTILRETILRVEITLPRVSEAKKMNHKSLINHIYVGKPLQHPNSLDAKIQINDAFIELEEVQDAVRLLDQSRPERLLPKVTTALVVDEEVEMGLVGDLKSELRKAKRLKVLYNALEEH